MFTNNIIISYDKNLITPLSSRKEAFWNLVNNSTFLSDGEKRQLLGIS
jgi:hypothetical protein